MEVAIKKEISTYTTLTLTSENPDYTFIMGFYRDSSGHVVNVLRIDHVCTDIEAMQTFELLPSGISVSPVTGNDTNN